MDDETVYKVAQALDNTQRERLRQLLNTNVESTPITKQKKKKQLWDKEEQESSKTKTPSSPPLRGNSDKCYYQGKNNL